VCQAAIMLVRHGLQCSETVAASDCLAKTEVANRVGDEVLLMTLHSLVVWPSHVQIV